MARDGAGTYSRIHDWQADAAAGIKIRADRMDAEDDSIATALTESIARDGQTTITANLPMAGFRHTGVGNASARTDYAATGQVVDGGLVWGGTAGGTADALTLTLTPGISAYAAGQAFRFKAGSSANTGAATLNVNSLGAKAIQINGTALAAGEIAANAFYEAIYDGTAFQLASLERPVVSQSDAEAGTSALPHLWTPQRVTQALRALAEPVGTVKNYIGTSAPTGWFLLNGDTIGSASSGATHASADYQTLYELFWDSMTDTHAPVSGGRGASAAADFAANKTLTMPDARGRALIGTGTGSGLTARTHGDDTIGSEDAIAVTHSHTAGTLAAVSGGAHTHDITVETASPGAGGFVAESDGTGSTNTVTAKALSGGAHGHSISGSTANAGSSGTDANMMPALALNVIVKY